MGNNGTSRLTRRHTDGIQICAGTKEREMKLKSEITHAFKRGQEVGESDFFNLCISGLSNFEFSVISSSTHTHTHTHTQGERERQTDRQTDRQTESGETER